MQQSTQNMHIFNKIQPGNSVHAAAFAATAVLLSCSFPILVLPGDKLPTRLCHGYGIEFVPGSTKMSHTGDITKEHSILSNATDSIDMPTFPPEAPSLVGAMYIGAQVRPQLWRCSKPQSILKQPLNLVSQNVHHSTWHMSEAFCLQYLRPHFCCRQTNYC